MKTRIYLVILASGAFAASTYAQTTGGGDLCATRIAPMTTQMADIQSDPGTDRKQGAAPAPSKDTGDKATAMNRILLVDLGERELKKRDDLKARKSDEKTGIPAPNCR